MSNYESLHQSQAKLVVMVAKLGTVLAERDALQARAEAAEAALKEAREQGPVAFVCDYNGYAIDGKHTEIDTALPVGTDLYASPVPAPAVAVPAEWREVMAELAADLQAACDAEHPHRDQYPSVMRRYNNDMEIVEKARALLQSAPQSSTSGLQLSEINAVMILCPTCGNKRCPKANNHRNACTGSNEPGQPGSAYPEQFRNSGEDSGV